MKLKPGLQTTEFWITAAAIGVQAAMAIMDKISASWAVTGVTVLGGIYTILRSLLKSQDSGKPTQGS